MTNWKYNVYLVDLVEENDEKADEDIDVKKCVDLVLNRLNLLKEEILKNDDDPDYIIDGSSGLDFVIDEFTYFDFNEPQMSKIERFNELMDVLYDFADWNFVWINTSDRRMNGIGKP